MLRAPLDSPNLTGKDNGGSSTECEECEETDEDDESGVAVGEGKSARASATFEIQPLLSIVKLTLIPGNCSSPRRKASIKGKCLGSPMTLSTCANM